jgi:hypothetical protein
MPQGAGGGGGGGGGGDGQHMIQITQEEKEAIDNVSKALIDDEA